MFEPFTEHARRSIVTAQEEAALLGHFYVGTEHLLLGLLAEEGAAAQRALIFLGVTPESARKAVKEVCREPEVQHSGPEMVFSPKSKAAIEAAFGEARLLADEFVGTAHLLLGMMKDSKGRTNACLKQLGIAPDKLRGELVKDRAEGALAV